MNNPNTTLNENETNNELQDQSMVIDESNSESNHSDEQSDKEKEEEEVKQFHNLQVSNQNIPNNDERKKIDSIQAEDGSSSSSSLTSLSSYSDLEEIGKTKSNSECVEDKSNITLVEEEESENTIKPITIPTKELENMKLDYLGNIVSCLSYNVIVRSAHGILPLKIGSIIFLQDRTVIGRVSEVFGPVIEPCYLIKLPRNKTIDQSTFSPNKQVFYCSDFANYLGTDDLDYSKPSDASKENDKEIPIEEQEFSDDEKERQSKRKKKNLARRKRLQKKSQNSKIGRKIQTIPIIVNKKTTNNVTNNNRNTNTQSNRNMNNTSNMNNRNNMSNRNTSYMNNMNNMNNNTNRNQIFTNQNNNIQYYQQPQNQPLIQNQFPNQFQNQNIYQNFNYNTQTEQPIIPNYGISRNNQNFQYNTQNNSQNIQFTNYIPPDLQQQQQQQQQNLQQNSFVNRNTSFVFRNPPQNKK
ncbi:h/aca ribonucleoprotein complex non-core subunit naf1 [Anaeramoeba flamelloides]|uniref:H/ACA ribonucleoprotein complex non-core subunit NAF1 n=1 Tax=Anaeramoeba flamelloides TaxID=1746091 RepID=A0AAV7ZYY1_9EUKA|nr:h/aca ribonucleoprotein complex non-core subunit naf1 [Anaeramoeba flamelloides]